ncbi:hypothetical protein APF79_03160 [bacterium BRH_c32]|nr:MAG: hypothetical protein APF79_03160 [bacterium BRH_c32]
MFSYELKEILYKTNSTCAICNQKIIDIDDSALDHIEQYWAGGKTIPENARLTHRYCNNARSRFDAYSNKSIIIVNPKVNKNRKRKTRTITIENEKIFCENSVSVLINTANWLINKGKITKTNCPIQLGKSVLINNSPIHLDKRPFFGAKILNHNLYLEGNWSTEHCIKKSKELLMFFGVSPTRFDLDD